MKYHVDMQAFAYAQGKPAASGQLKTDNEDFQVSEILGVEPEGTGNHAWLWVEKQGYNTDWVASKLAALAGVKMVDIGFAGLKDRHGITRQWFSVNLQNVEEPDWARLAEQTSNRVSVLRAERHSRKIKRGMNKGNSFVIRLRDIELDQDVFQKRVAQLHEFGVPNYYTEQRFGREGENVQKLLAWTRGELKPRKNEKSIYLSAGRSFLFNHLLSRRITDGSWQALHEGELAMLDGTHSVFLVETVDETIADRLRTRDIHPAGMLYGKGKFQPSSIEQSVYSEYSELTAALARHNMTQDYRSLRLIPENFLYSVEPLYLQVSFSLPSGCYATAVLRELVDYYQLY